MVSIEYRLDAVAEKFPEVRKFILKQHEVPNKNFNRLLNDIMPPVLFRYFVLIF